MLLALAMLMAASATAARPMASRGLLQSFPVAPNTTGVENAGFVFGSEVGTYTLIPQDICDISSALSGNNPDFATAMDIYEQGKNVPGRNNTLRNLKAFATGALYATPLPFRLTYIDYLSELYFMDAAVEEALTLTPATTSAQASGLTGPGAAVGSVLKLSLQGLLMVNYVMHEMEGGLNKTQTGAANNTDPARGAPHNVDEAWGLYAGAGVCGSILSLVTEMSKAFGARRDSVDRTKCESLTHNAILAAFKKMYAAALASDATAFKKGRDSLASLIAVPFIQGTIKAAAEVSRRVGLKQSAVLPLAQGYGYWRAVEPLVAAVDQDAADAVTAALKAAVPKMGIPPALVGGLGTKQYLQCDGSKPALDRCLAKCPTTPKTVCGANGKTYRTRCAALCYGTTVRRSGKC
ncbi:hypothetical protein ABPG75_007254 [Micractinium tetrahymenae]